MDDVEFVVEPTPEPQTGRSAPAADEDLIEVAPRAMPPWARPVATFALLALAVTGLVLRNQPHTAPSAQPPGPAPVLSVTPTEVPEPLPLSPVGDPLERVSTQASVDVAVAGNLVYTLRDGVLTTADAYRGTELGRVPITGLDAFEGVTTMRLFLDPRTYTAWVLSENVFPHQILEFNSVSLRERRMIVAPDPIYSAVTLAGRLYLLTAEGLEVLAPGHGVPTLILRSTAPFEALAADPGRGRLLAVDSNLPQHVLAISPDGSVTQAATTRLVSPTLAVAADRIWLGGYTGSGPVLWRLDADTLTMTASSPVAEIAGPGAQVVAGENVLWVSSGLGVPQQLWCVNAETGAVGGVWPGASGTVSSQDGIAYGVRNGRAVVLPLGANCRG